MEMKVAFVIFILCMSTVAFVSEARRLILYGRQGVLSRRETREKRNINKLLDLYQNNYEDLLTPIVRRGKGSGDLYF